MKYILNSASPKDMLSIQKTQQESFRDLENGHPSLILAQLSSFLSKVDPNELKHILVKVIKQGPDASRTC